MRVAEKMLQSHGITDWIQLAGTGKATKFQPLLEPQTGPVLLLCVTSSECCLCDLLWLFSLAQRPITLTPSFLNFLTRFLLGLGAVSHQRCFPSPVQAGGEIQEVHGQSSSPQAGLVPVSGGCRCLQFIFPSPTSCCL